MQNNSFTILPMSQRFSLDPGKTYKGKITIVNPADATSDFEYIASVSPYSVVGEDYTADLVTQSNHSEISKWIKISEPVGKVAPNESKDVEFTIKVPVDAAAGGQYATINVSSNAANSSDNGVSVQNIFEMASVIYANVSGEIVHDGEIIENNIPGFSAVTPVTLSALISNNGNVHEDATFVIAVSDVFSGHVILPTEEDAGQYNEIIMPDSTKKIERNISNLPAIGLVKVSQTIYYNGDVSIVEKNIFICPIWFMALALLTFAAVITTIVMIIRHHHKKNKRTVL